MPSNLFWEFRLFMPPYFAGPSLHPPMNSPLILEVYKKYQEEVMLVRENAIVQRMNKKCADIGAL